MYRFTRATRKVILYTVLIAIALVQLFPLYWLFTFSLKDNMKIFQTNPLGLPTVYHFEKLYGRIGKGQGGVLPVQ